MLSRICRAPSFLVAELYQSPITPIGYQTNLMVYGPGGYRFTDFVRMGAPLQVLLALVTCGGSAGPSRAHERLRPVRAVIGAVHGCK